MQGCLCRWNLPFWLQSFQYENGTFFFEYISTSLCIPQWKRTWGGKLEVFWAHKSPDLKKNDAHWFPLVFWTSCLRNMTFSLFSAFLPAGETTQISSEATTMRDQGLAVLGVIIRGCLWFGGGSHKLLPFTMHYWCWAIKQSLKSLGWVQETFEIEEWMICIRWALLMNILLCTDTQVNIWMWPFVWRAVLLQTSTKLKSYVHNDLWIMNINRDMKRALRCHGDGCRIMVHTQPDGFTQKIGNEWIPKTYPKCLAQAVQKITCKVMLEKAL